MDRASTPVRIARAAIQQQQQQARQGGNGQRSRPEAQRRSPRSPTTGTSAGAAPTDQPTLTATSDVTALVKSVENDSYRFETWAKLVHAVDSDVQVSIPGTASTASVGCLGLTQLCTEALRRTPVAMHLSCFVDTATPTTPRRGRARTPPSASGAQARAGSAGASRPPSKKGVLLPLPDKHDEFSVWFYLISQGFTEADDVALWEVTIEPLLGPNGAQPGSPTKTPASSSSTSGAKKPTPKVKGGKKGDAPAPEPSIAEKLPGARYMDESRPHDWTMARMLDYVVSRFVLDPEQEKEGRKTTTGEGEEDSPIGKRWLSSLWAFCVRWIWTTDGILVIGEVPFGAVQCQMRAAKLGAPWALVTVGSRLSQGETIEVQGEQLGQLGCFRLAAKENIGTEFKVLQDALTSAIHKGPPFAQQGAYWRELSKTLISKRNSAATAGGGECPTSPSPSIDVGGEQYTAKECLIHGIALTGDGNEECTSESQQVLLTLMAEGEVVELCGAKLVRVGNSLFPHDLEAPVATGDTMPQPIAAIPQPTPTRASTPPSSSAVANNGTRTGDSGGGGVSRATALQRAAVERRERERARQQTETKETKVQLPKSPSTPEPPAPTTQQSTIEIPVPDTLMCVVCTASQRNCALLPCHHMVTCMQCAVGIMGKCPICRNVVTKVIPIYLA